ncbi:hypothetical protein [Halobacteriovorax sp. HLS]|uniref:hypothetical protein n=1 Tax=Halobacteriovorax sp. HLS TaxID=2234000 RepID=UPI000FDA53C3|nr:hypothetical protein [Halobacteriovorax sp. HLS]
MKNLILIFFILASTHVNSREVDNYLAWGVELRDSGKLVDKYIYENLQKSIQVINENKYQFVRVHPRSARRKKVIAKWYDSCELVAHKIMKEAFYSPTYQKIEGFIDNSKELDTYPRRPLKSEEARQELNQTVENGYMTDDEYLKESIVQKSPLNSPLSRIVNIYGVYVGADKFGHFTSFGARYLKKIYNLMNKGRSYDEALNKVLHYGHRSEKSYVGMLLTKVFSRADLEANYQGLVFTRSLCSEDSKVKLFFDGEKWEFIKLKDFTVKDYVNPNWDESWNNSLFTQKKWNESVVKTFERRNECKKLDSPFVVRQREFYHSFKSISKNKIYEKEWLKKKFEDIQPEDFSLESFCL